MSGSWGEVPWGGNINTEASSGVEVEEKRVVVTNSEEVIIMGDDD